MSVPILSFKSNLPFSFLNYDNKMFSLWQRSKENLDQFNAHFCRDNPLTRQCVSSKKQFQGIAQCVYLQLLLAGAKNE